jgi:hypothetical protein
MRTTAYLLVAAFALAVPAVAADQKQCADQFKAADLNNDGALSRSEMGNAKQTMPGSLNNKSRVSRKQYLSACSKVAKN